MKVEITRSFSKKVQLRQFEPIEVFCAAKAEVDVQDLQDKKMDFVSGELNVFCAMEVAKTINEARPALKERDEKAAKKKGKDVGRDSAEHDTIEEINLEQ